MTGPDPAEKKPARSTSSRAKTTKPDPGAAPAPDAAPPAEPSSPVEPVSPVTAAAAEVEPVVVAAQMPPAAPAPPPVLVEAPGPVSDTGAPSVVEPPTVAAAPAPAPVPAPTQAPAAEPSADGAAAAAAPAAAKLSTPDIAGAVDKAVDRLRTHLTVGEIVAGLGAVIILAISWLTFGVIFGHEGTWPSDVVMLLCIGMLAALVLQNAHIHDFGPNYRVIVAGICFALGILAVLSFVYQLRFVFDGLSFNIGGLTWWAGAWISVIGGFLVWREGR